MPSDIPPPDDRFALCPSGGDSPDPVPDESSPVSELVLTFANASLDEAAANLDTASTEVQSVLSDVADTVAGELTAASFDAGTAVSDIIGGIDSALTGVATPVIIAIDKLVAATDKVLRDAQDEVYSSGINYPFDPARQTQLSAAGDFAIVADAVPAIGEALAGEPNVLGFDTVVGVTGVDTVAGGTGDIGVDASFTVSPYQPVPTYGSPFPPPPPSPPDTPVPILGGLLSDMDQFYANAGAVPLSDSPPTSPPPPPASLIGDDGKCCPPAVVNVNVGQLPTVVGTPVPVPVVGTTIINVPTAPPVPTVPPVPPPPPPPITAGRLPDAHATAACANWDVADPCMVGTFSVPLPSPESLSDTKVRWALEDVLKFADGVVSIELPGYQSIKAGVNLAAGHDGIETWATSYYSGAKLANDLIDTLTGNCVKDKATVAKLAVLLGTCAWTETITGAPMQYLGMSNRYQFQFLNPQFLIGQADVDNLYLRTKITDANWECLTKANGNLPQWHRAARDAKQALLTPDQLVQSWRRKRITSVQLYDTLAEHGFINSNYITEMVALSEQPLTPSDLVSGMKRDVFDEKVVAKYQYDKDFTEKFTGQAQEWAYWQGFSAEQFRYLWRAHWVIPSNTQLYEMLHRLRPDRPEYVAWKKNADEGENAQELGALGDEPPVVTIDDVKEALEINDVAPAWVDRLIATSYHTINNSDATRMYLIGYYDNDELTAAFQDNGYDKSTSETLTEFWEFETNKRVRSQSGVLTPRKVIRLYRDGAISRNDARGYLEDIFPNEKQLDKLLSLADKETDAEFIQVQSKYLRRSLITGELTRADVIAEMRNLGVDAQAANRISQIWDVERTHRSKEVTAMMLCKWRDRGLITMDDHVARLQRLGYPESDARTIARVCDIDSAAKRAKQLAKDAKEQQRNAKSNLLQDIAKYKKELAALLQQISDANEKLFGTDALSSPDQPNKSDSGGGG